MSEQSEEDVEYLAEKVREYLQMVLGPVDAQKLKERAAEALERLMPNWTVEADVDEENPSLVHLHLIPPPTKFILLTCEIDPITQEREEDA